MTWPEHKGHDVSPRVVTSPSSSKENEFKSGLIWRCPGADSAMCPNRLEILKEILQRLMRDRGWILLSLVQHIRVRDQRPLIKVHFNVAYRCHSRQLLCMGGSQFPFGWSFVSIAKLPMTWNPRDMWTAEARHSILYTQRQAWVSQVYLPMGMRLEYKYVILEEQARTDETQNCGIII